MFHQNLAESWICLFDGWKKFKKKNVFLPQKDDDLVMALWQKKVNKSIESSPPRPHKKKTAAIETKQQPSQRLLVQNN